MPEKSDEFRMSAVEWREAIANIAGPVGHDDTRESWLARAARKANITFRQAKALYYGECADPRYSVAVKVRQAAEKIQREEEALRNDVAEIWDRLSKLETRISEIDQDAGSALADRVVQGAGVAGGKDCAMDRGED